MRRNCGRHYELDIKSGKEQTTPESNAVAYYAVANGRNPGVYPDYSLHGNFFSVLEDESDMYLPAVIEMHTGNSLQSPVFTVANGSASATASGLRVLRVRLEDCYALMMSSRVQHEPKT
ncbi:hypothetical protein KCU95_g18147, partial [Aureobasidium melanogenum]